MMLSVCGGILEQSAILALLAFGLMIPFRFLRTPDASIEGAYPLGGVVCSCVILLGYPGFFGILAGAFSGMLLCALTAWLTFRLRIHSLLTGIILSSMAYSLNLKLMGKPNVSLFQVSQGLGEWGFGVVLGAVLLCLAGFWSFLKTDFGLRFRAVGLSPIFAGLQKLRVGAYTVLGFAMAGFAFGLGGSLMVQLQSYADVGMGVGIVVHGLASLMMGETLLGNETLLKQLMAPLLGSIIYQCLQTLVLWYGAAPCDFRLMTGAGLLCLLALQKRVCS